MHVYTQYYAAMQYNYDGCIQCIESRSFLHLKLLSKNIKQETEPIPGLARRASAGSLEGRSTAHATGMLPALSP